MSTEVTINLTGTTHEIPNQGALSDTAYGEKLHDLLVDIVSSLNSVVDTGDILEQQTTLSDSTSAANVGNLSFSVGSLTTSSTLSGVIDFYIKRDNLIESGQMDFNYEKHVDASANMNYTVESVGDDTGVTLTMTDSGQVQYQTNAVKTFTTGFASNVITITDHGFVTGMTVRASTSGTLPTGLAIATDYFVIKLTNNTFSLASSFANAVAGTAVAITDATGSGTHTITPTTSNFFIRFKARTIYNA